MLTPGSGDVKMGVGGADTGLLGGASTTHILGQSRFYPTPCKTPQLRSKSPVCHLEARPCFSLASKPCKKTVSLQHHIRFAGSET